MIEVIDNLHTCQNGMPDVCLHQDVSVGLDLTMILWSAGLRVTSAWNIATETELMVLKRDYVKGTVFCIRNKIRRYGLS